MTKPTINIPELSEIRELTANSIKDKNYIDMDDALNDIIEQIKTKASNGEYSINYSKFNFTEPTNNLHDHHHKIIDLLKEKSYDVDHYAKRGIYRLRISWR